MSRATWVTTEACWFAHLVTIGSAWRSLCGVEGFRWDSEGVKGKAKCGICKEEQATRSRKGQLK